MYVPLKFVHHTYERLAAFVELRTVCLQALSVLCDLDGLHNEGAVLSRMIYHLKCKLRTDKSFKAVEKVNRSLRRYLCVDAANVFSILTPAEPARTDDHGYLPSRQMLEFVLVRTQGLAQVFRHLVEACEEAARQLAMKLAVGHMWCASLALYAIVSRVWVYARYLALSACEWFNKLKSFLGKLSANPTPWLPEGYTFPTDLADWLNVSSWTQAPRRTPGSHTGNLFRLINSGADDGSRLAFKTESDGEDQSSSWAVNFEENASDADVNSVVKQGNQGAGMKKHQKNNTKNKKLKMQSDVEVPGIGSSDDTDIEPRAGESAAPTEAVLPVRSTLCTMWAAEDTGERVCRETVPERGPAGRMSAAARRRVLGAVSGHEELAELLARESRLRCGSEQERAACLTAGLDKLAWRLLRKALGKLVRSLEREARGKRYNQLLWEAKQILRHHVL